MKDRVPVNPGRVLITPENGSAAYYATMTRADNPTQNGTPLNKASLLKDATAALFGLGADAVPDDVLNAIKSLIDGANANANEKVRVATGSYTGTGTFGADNPNSLTFGFVPDLVLIIGDGSKVDTINYQALTLYAVLWYGDATAYLTFVNTSNAGTSNSTGIALSWDSTTVTWYVTATNATAASQMSSSGKVYRYLAIKL